MSTVYLASSTAEPLELPAVDGAGDPLTGLTDLYVRVRRLSDGFFWDWSDDTFKTAASVVAIDGVLAEVSATYAPGQYSRSWPGAAAGTYLATFTQTGSSVANVPAMIELRVGQLPTAAAVADLPAAVWAVPEGTRTYGASLALIRKYQTNRMEVDLVGGGRERLWDDGDNSAVIQTRTLLDAAGNPISTPAGSPARRGAAT